MKFIFIILMLIHTHSYALVNKEIEKLEKLAHGKIGVSAIDTSTHQIIEYHAQDYFPFCSTYKVLGVAAILKASMSEAMLLNNPNNGFRSLKRLL